MDKAVIPIEKYLDFLTLLAVAKEILNQSYPYDTGNFITKPTLDKLRKIVTSLSGIEDDK